MLGIADLRCEYRRNPLGIGVQQPRLSWKLDADDRNVRQTAYEIEIGADDAFRDIIWRSGRRESEQSTLIGLDGLEQHSGQRYYYRVRVWDNKGRTSGWFGPAYWENGLLSPEDWTAEWIAAPQGLPAGEETAPPRFRRSFRIKGEVSAARIYATALGLYELELNGRRVGDDYFTPGWTSYRHRLQTQTYDVTPLLREGGNAVGAQLGNGWYKGNLAWEGNSCLYGDRLALLLQLRIDYKDGTSETIVSDPSWKTATGPILMSEIYHGETYDARLEHDGWSSFGFDDGHWTNAVKLEHSKSILLPQLNEPVRKLEEIKPIAVLQTPDGHQVLDFGQNMVGWVRLSVRGEAGQTVELKHAEVLDQAGNLYLDNLRSAKQTVRYVLRGGETEIREPRFSFQGFRYVQVTGLPAPLSADDFTGVVLHSDFERTGDFACSEPLVNQLQRNIVWGLKGNFLDVPTDCPQRDERLGWTGDAQMFIPTAAYLMQVAPFFTKWLGDVAADQAADGGMPHVVPNVLGSEPHSSAAWGDAAVICPWTIYVSYGDKQLLKRQYASMRRWVEFIRAQGDNEYLWNTGFHFGDWLGLDAKSGDYVGATERDLIATAFYAHSADLLRRAAEALDRDDEVEHWRELHSRIVAAFGEEFVTPAGRLAVPTQTAHVLALRFRLLDEAAERRAVKKLQQLIEDNRYHLTTGFVGTPYLNPVLSEYGLNRTAYKLLLQQTYPSWLYPVTKGATTIWEHWDGIKEDGSFWSPNMNSFNHYAYGAIGEWLYSVVAGIRPIEQTPGYKEFVIAPLPGEGLSWAEGSLESPYGRIRARWSIEEGERFVLEADVPPNTTATIHLPGTGALEAIAESGVPLAVGNGILSVSRHADKPDAVVVSVGSGNYSFAYPFSQSTV